MLDIADRALTAGHTIRSFDFTQFEFRDDSPTGVTFEGVASVVDTPYEVRDMWGTFTETIRAGAFNKTLKDGAADVALFVNHDTRALPLATRLDGSLVLAATPHLSVRATLNPARPSVQEVRHAVTDGQARQMSIGFSVPKDTKKDVWNADFSERMIHEVKLNETSIVWRGASPTTSGAMRSLDEFLAEWSWDDADVERAFTFIGNLRAESPADRAAADAAAAAIAAFEARDRADRERLDMKNAMRPAIYA